MFFLVYLQYHKYGSLDWAEGRKNGTILMHSDLFFFKGPKMFSCIHTIEAVKAQPRPQGECRLQAELFKIKFTIKNLYN